MNKKGLVEDKAMEHAADRQQKKRKEKKINHVDLD